MMLRLLEQRLLFAWHMRARRRRYSVLPMSLRLVWIKMWASRWEKSFWLLAFELIGLRPCLDFSSTQWGGPDLRHSQSACCWHVLLSRRKTPQQAYVLRWMLQSVVDMQVVETASPACMAYVWTVGTALHTVDAIQGGMELSASIEVGFLMIAGVTAEDNWPILIFHLSCETIWNVCTRSLPCILSELWNSDCATSASFCLHCGQYSTLSDAGCMDNMQYETAYCYCQPGEYSPKCRFPGKIVSLLTEAADFCVTHWMACTKLHKSRASPLHYNKVIASTVTDLGLPRNSVLACTSF